jgi:predicted O-linked N-acetylglucosamine transferase (SPINDLY family)
VPSALEASKRVLKDKLDVLIDLDGYSNEGLRRSELFVLRHAPVTVRESL